MNELLLRRRVAAVGNIEILDWIENTYKNANIITDFIPNSENLVFRFKFLSIEKDRNYTSLFIQHTSNNNESVWRFAHNEGPEDYHVYSCTTSSSIVSNNRLTGCNYWTHDIVLTSSSVTIDGVTATLSGQRGTTNNNPLRLFEDAVNSSVFRLYYLDVYNTSDELVASFRTARKNGIVGVYNIVTNTFIAPNTGVFTAGYGIYDAQVEFVQSDGSAYIETYVKLKNTSIVDVKFKYVSGNLFGTRNPNTPQASFGVTVNAAANTMAVDLYASTAQISSARLTVAMSANSIYSVHVENGNRYVKDADGNTIGSNTYSTGSFTSQYNCPLSTIRWTSGTARAECGTNPIYMFSIKEGQTSVLDFIPVRIGNRGFVYDGVKDKIFKPIDGIFNIGNDV